MTRRQKLLMAAVAGITVGATTPALEAAEGKKDEVKCWGVNSCGHHAKCSVTQADLDAMKKLLGEKEFVDRFGKSELHTCGSHAKCGASAHILNWAPAAAGECTAKGGYRIDTVDGQRVAKKG